MVLQYRHINDSDNLKDIFSMIYQGDPFIYRDLFTNTEIGYKIYQQICQNPMSLFYVGNYRIVVDEETQEILAVCSFFTNGVKWIPSVVEQAYVMINVPIPESFDSVSKYFLKTYNYKHHLVGACNISVKEGHRGQGIGDFILKSLLEEIQDEDVQLTVLKDNIPAVKLYQKNGFKIIDEFYDYGGHKGEDVLCYQMYRFAKQNK